MSIGAERIEAPADEQAVWEQTAAEPQSWTPTVYGGHEDEEPRSAGAIALASVLILLSIAWAFYVLLPVATGAQGGSPRAWADAVPTLCLPLVLFALVWLIFGRTPRREAERFTRAVTAMRAESQALESVLAIVGDRLETNRANLTQESARLMALGDEAVDRLGRATHFIAKESTELERRAQALESAADSARVDIGVLLSDLPNAEARAQAVASAIKDAGLAAHGQAGALENQLSALVARGREADEIAAGSAQRLGAQLAQIDSTVAGASDRMDGAAAQMNAAIDGALARASSALDETRTSLDAQGQTVLAVIDQHRAAWEDAGAEASRLLGQRLDEIGARIEAMAQHLIQQEQSTRNLVDTLQQRLAELGGAVDELGSRGGDTHARLSQGIESVRAAAQVLGQEVEVGQNQAGLLIDRTHEIAQSLSQLSARFREELPAAMQVAETQAARTHEAAAAAVPPMEAIQAAAALAAESVSESEKSVARQQGAVDALLASVREGSATAEERLAALSALVDETDSQARRLTTDTGPELIEALLRVREAANQAASHAREAILASIPEAAASLGNATRDAVGEAVTEPVRSQVAQLAVVSEQAVAAAKTASERLTRQLLTIGETAAKIEARIADERAEREAQEGKQLSRRVALLIESLNSTAIDVAKILSNDVTDTAWAAYLKGDRGVFTRRAVRLLDSGEAREILRHYDEEPEFRDQVNRYVHDFEALLRRVLADRDGNPLGLTLLSSDMGKLYVALAQAIERLRR